jgi:UDP-N-acetyl-D-mannosaminuronate dehydrogenase
MNVGVIDIHWAPTIGCHDPDGHNQPGVVDANADVSTTPQYDCILIVSDHSEYDYAKLVREAQLVVDTRNATAGIHSANVVRC